MLPLLLARVPRARPGTSVLLSRETDFRVDEPPPGGAGDSRAAAAAAAAASSSFRLMKPKRSVGSTPPDFWRISSYTCVSVMRPTENSANQCIVT